MSAKLDYLKRYMPSKQDERKKREKKLLEKLDLSAKAVQVKQASMPAKQKFIEMKDDESGSVQGSRSSSDSDDSSDKVGKKRRRLDANSSSSDDSDSQHEIKDASAAL